jgi:proton-translocating NADH-quinone oxidoreductase chain L
MHEPLNPLFEYSWLILLAPLFAFAVIIFGTRALDLRSRPRVVTAGTSEASHGGHNGYKKSEHESDDGDPRVPSLTFWARMSAYVAIVIMAAACVYSWVLLFTTASNPEALGEAGITVLHYPWLAIGDLTYEVSFHLDNLAIAMLVVVTTVTLLVQFYSQSYMENSAGYARFFSYLSLFAFSMLVIVFAENFLVIFVGWELVGLSSYLLIGFWINKRAKPEELRPSPATASLQAFVVNRIGDVGFIIGIMILFTSVGTFSFHELIEGVKEMDKTLLTIAMICVFCGAVGKSAQIPLHIWLPAAMEGPTPVSALIHAATMVAAGVYMVARTYPLFAAADPLALEVVAWVGGITAFFAATVALVQTDFKRVLAYSTMSQLGYMFVGLGIAGHEYGAAPGMFHLFTHAFFKALLFLGAGSVIHSLHHAMHKEVQDMRLMGGLGPKMPITAITWLIATLSISGFPFFAGFFSKEEIIGLTFEHEHWGLYVLTLVTAGMTAFYMLRAFILAFGGKGGRLGGLWGGPYRGSGQPHESPLTITIPLILLAIASIFAGYWTGFFPYVNPEAPTLDVVHLLSLPDTWVGVAVSFVGLIWAFILYARVEPAKLDAVVQGNSFLRTMRRILYHRYYIEDFYDLFVRYFVLGISYAEQAFDTYVVDGIVNGTARLVSGLGSRVRRLETGWVQVYMVGFFGGVVVLAVLVFVLVTFAKG